METGTATGAPDSRWGRLSRRLDEHSNAVIFALLVLSLLTAGWAAIGWTKASDAQKRVGTLEAEQLGKHIADVTTCFNTARNRPRLVVILRGIAVQLDPFPRKEMLGLISDYEAGTPTRVACVALADKYGIDPKPYLKNPPSEAGNKEGK